jgi:hypothetical protein
MMTAPKSIGQCARSSEVDGEPASRSMFVGTNTTRELITSGFVRDPPRTPSSTNPNVSRPLYASVDCPFVVVDDATLARRCRASDSRMTGIPDLPRTWSLFIWREPNRSR